MNATRNQVRLSRFLTMALLLTVVTGGIPWWIFDGHGDKRITAYFTRAVGVYTGSDVRLLGVRIGEVETVTPDGERVEVTMRIDGSIGVAEDANVLVIAPSVVSDRYVQFSKPSRGGPRLANGAVIGVERTGTPVELDELYASLNTLATALGPNGANSNGALSDLLNIGAANLRGNGRPFNDSVREFADLARTLAGNKDDLFGTVDELQRFTTMLAGNDIQVSNINSRLATVTQTLASNKTELTSALDGLGRALADVQDFLKENRALIKSNVDNLAVTTQTLVDKRAVLAETLDDIPLAVTDVLNAFDPKSGTLQGRTVLDYYLLPLPVTGPLYQRAPK